MLKIVSLFDRRGGRLISLARPVILNRPVAAWSAYPDNSDLTLTDQWADFYGGEELKLVRTSGWIYLVHPDDRLRFIRTWVPARARGIPYVNTYRALVHGVYRPCTSHVFPAFDREGHIVRWRGYNQLADGKAVNF